MKINYNEGGKWFTFYFNTQGHMILRVWFGPTLFGYLVFAVSFSIFNPWAAKKALDEHMTVIRKAIDDLENHV